MNTTQTRRWWALGALALSMLAVGIDATVLNLALPTLANSLHASTTELQWFVGAYSLVLAATLLPAGLLGDRFGRKRWLLIALGMFGIASVACAFAPSAAWLIAARALLGLGAAFLMPLSMSVLPVLFSEEERPKAIAIWTAANAISFPIGPIVGGWLLSKFWWGSVFLINVPVVIVGIVAVLAWLPESRNPQTPRVDLLGVLLSSIGLVGLTYAVITAGQKGWGDSTTLLTMALGLVALTSFILWERAVLHRGGEPLADIKLFRSRSFTWGTLLATLVNFALFGVLFTVPQYFQAIRGTDAMGSGLRLLPLIGGLLIGAGISSKTGKKFGAKLTVAFGFVLLAAGLVVGSKTQLDSSDSFVIFWIGLVGMGLGFVMPGAMNAALGALSSERSGTGSALIQALRQVGGTIGVALLGTVLNSAYRSGLDTAGLPAPVAEAVQKGVSAGVMVAQKLGSAPLLEEVRSAFLSGMSVMLWVCGGIAVLGVGLALLFLPSQSVELAEKLPEQVH